jgi:uncharacterized protein YdgA (DUF945 family)
MRRVALFAVAAVALIFVGLPPLLGMLTESQVAARVAALDSSGALKVSLRSYERGWFRSRARITVALAPQLIAKLDALGAAGGLASFAGTLDRRMPIEVEITHGPLAFLDGVHVGWSTIVARLDRQSGGVAGLERTLGVPYVFEFRGRTDFAGGIAFAAEMPPIDLTIAGARVDFSGAELAGTFADGRLIGSGRLDRFELTSPPGAFSINEVRAATDTEIRSAYALPGDSSLSIARISIVDAARGPMPVLDADDIRVAGKIELDPSAALLNLHASYDVDSLFVEGARVAGASLGLAVQRLDIAALESYLDAARAEASGLAPSPELDTALARALAAGPSLVLDPVRFRVNEEPFTAHVELAANRAALPPAGSFDPEDPAAVLPALRGAATVDVSKKLAREIAVVATELRYGDGSLEPEQSRLLAEAQAGLILVTLVGQGILEDAGETYRAELRLADGALTLNGTALPFGVP